MPYYPHVRGRCVGSQSGGSLPRVVKGRGRSLHSPECPSGWGGGWADKWMNWLLRFLSGIRLRVCLAVCRKQCSGWTKGFSLCLFLIAILWRLSKHYSGKTVFAELTISLNNLVFDARLYHTKGIFQERNKEILPSCNPWRNQGIWAIVTNRCFLTKRGEAGGQVGNQYQKIPDTMPTMKCS